jgi:hypothetical protein
VIGGAQLELARSSLKRTRRILAFDARSRAQKSWQATLPTFVLSGVSPLETPPEVTIAASKDQAFDDHNRIYEAYKYDPKTIFIYTDGSGYKGEVGVAALAPSIAKVKTQYLGPMASSTVYLGELQGIKTGLQITKE